MLRFTSMFTRNSKSPTDLKTKLVILSCILIVVAVVLNIVPLILGYRRFDLYEETLGYNIGRELFPSTILFLLSISAPYLLSILVLTCVNILYFCYSVYDFFGIIPLLGKTFEHEYYNILHFSFLLLCIIPFAIIYIGLHSIYEKMKSNN